MANKTIHQLTPASTITGDTQFAIYDTVSDSTKKATASQILGTEDILYADDPSTPSGTVDFTTQDTSLNPTSSVSVDLLTGSDSWSQRFVKISQMFKNIRYLFGKLGSTDISSIGDGSVTGAVSTLNSKFITIVYEGDLGALAANTAGYITANITIPEGYITRGIATIALGHPLGSNGLLIVPSILSNLSGNITFYPSYYAPKAVSNGNTDFKIYILCSLV